ncbi:MAG: nucleotidyltransferase domain-containing protein [Synergistaceae bacterium]|nr:nucleotidyltransferase domain-containing protein [Synergistaceae bacterium]
MTYPEKKSIHDKAMFDDIVNAILSVMGDDAVKIILYGSVARGNNTWDSDVDIAVLTTRHYDCKARNELWNSLWEYDLKYDTLFSIVPIDLYKFFQCKYDILLYMNIEKESITLWKKYVMQNF